MGGGSSELRDLAFRVNKLEGLVSELLRLVRDLAAGDTERSSDNGALGVTPPTATAAASGKAAKRRGAA